ncbi:winged helix-turn-helix domain-containing tetratricopeptide repeat protein [Roseibium sp. MMSF_3544]|uniref:winged helix-turn-helix domain-containing tetratricopeptide repeat protein n=1 Tax=unclassified Roseibium TaxID=2629323 RepID=UPI00273D26A1|nr:winged helix-turn-helix domain-containing protein [Roseibium sp. MMSF_3544]
MIYRFEEFELNVEKRELLRGSNLVSLEPQVFSLLLLLIENHDRVVSKDEIIEKIWGGRFISEAAVSSRISEVRKALGEGSKERRFIRTLYKQGFRFQFEPTTPPDSSPTTSTGTQDAPANKEHNQYPVIVVLPFSGLPTDPEFDWLIDGICDDIITGLSRFRELRVISRLSSFGLASLNQKDLDAAIEDLSADYIVEGNVRRIGSAWRLQVSIVSTGSQSQIWSERCTLEQSSLQNLDPITDRIVAAIEPELLSAERDRIRRKPETDLTTWESTQKGLWLLWQQKSGLHEQAVSVLRSACERDPDYALAHAGLAYALCHAYKEGVMGSDALEQALVAARQAVQLDQRDAFSYVALGRSHLARQEYDEAISAYDEAIALNHNHAYGHFGKGYSLSLSGKAGAAIKHFETVLELSPRDPQGWSVCVLLCFSNLIIDQPETALSWAQRSLRMPNAPHWAKAAEAAAFKALGQEKEAELALDEALAARPDLNAAFLNRAYPFADQRDFKKLSEFMLGNFVPDVSQDRSTDET